MKKSFLLSFIVSLLVLSGCTGTSDKIPQKDPFLPSVSNELHSPKIPSRELKASVLDAFPQVTKNDDEGLFEAVDKGIQNPTITHEDLKRGWYMGQSYEKRYATPSSWIWMDRGEQSVWKRPDVVLDDPLQAQANLCTTSGGYFKYSCYDFKAPQCNYTAKSTCKCAPQTRWTEEEGCLLFDELNDFVTIKEEEIKQGWYSGDIAMKKKNTPPSWIWINRGAQSVWQNPPVDTP